LNFKSNRELFFALTFVCVVGWEVVLVEVAEVVVAEVVRVVELEVKVVKPEVKVVIMVEEDVDASVEVTEGCKFSPLVDKLLGNVSTEIVVFSWLAVVLIISDTATKVVNIDSSTASSVSTRRVVKDDAIFSY
jgi:hypothetical protein